MFDSFLSLTNAYPDISQGLGALIMLAYHVAAKLFALPVLASCLVAQVHDQFTDKPPSSAPIFLDWSYRKDVQEVYVLFSASLHGKFVPDLAGKDVRVVDDGSAPEKILAFYRQSDLPLRMGLLIDTSPSVSSRFTFEQNAAQEFLTEVVGSYSDAAFLIEFADIPRLVQAFTSKPGELKGAVKTLVDQGNSTSLFDAVVQGCRELVNHPEDRFVARTLVVVSDGEDNSSLATLQRATLAAQNSEVTIYTISTRSPWIHYGPTGGERILKTLAQETGGRAIFPGSPDNLRSAFAHIAEELHSRYAISYRPAHFTLDGHYRRIQIKAERSGKKLKVQARQGYYASARMNVLGQPK